MAGLLWFDGPELFSQRMSAAANEMESGGPIKGIVEENLQKAAETMESIVQSGGINPTKKGGPRVRSGDMIESIDSKMFINARGRVQGEVGFINSPPEWTKYQELGTGGAGTGRGGRGNASGGGIAAMLAFATANQEMITKLQNELESGAWWPTSLR